MTLKQEIKAAAREARRRYDAAALAGKPYEAVTLSNGFAVHVTGIRIPPSGGACRAWKYLYYLTTPAELVSSSLPRQTGGYDTQASFVDWAARFLSATVRK